MNPKRRLANLPAYSQLFALLIFVSAISLLPVVLLNAWSTSAEIRERTQQRELLLAHATVVRIEEYFATILHWEQDFSDRPALRDWLAAGDYSDPRMRSRWESEILRPFRQRMDLAGTFVATPRGEVVLLEGSVPLPRGLPSWQPFREAAKGRERISEVFHGPGDESPFVAVLAPVREPGGRILAVVGVIDPLHNLRRLVKNDTDSAGVGSFGILADENWVPLIHGTTPSLEGIPYGNPALTESLQALRRDPKASPFVYHYQPSTGEWGLGAQVLLKRTPWVYYLGAPATYLNAPVRQQVNIAIGVFFGLLVVMAGLSRGLARWFTRPLLRLQEGAMAWENGDLATRVSVSGSREVRSLGESFNHMAATIQAYTEDLERIVRERTEQLRETEERLCNVVRNAPLYMIAFDADDQIVLEEGQGMEAFGQESGPNIGRSVFAVFGGIPGFIDHYRRARSGETFRALVEIGERVFDAWFSASEPPEGDRGGVICVASDITDRRCLELALKSQYEQLQRLDRLRTTLFNMVSHDLRTPLTSIVGYSEFLEDGIGGRLPSQQLQYVQQIKMAAKRLEFIVSDLLDYARMQAGTFQLRLESADFSQKVQEIAESMRPQMDEKELDFMFFHQAGPLVTQMDQQRVGQVVANLLHNAIKFSPVGGCLRIRVRREGANLLCEIEDSGIGIAAEDLSKLFKEFSQLENGKQKGGTGLGLSICKAVVTAHGGQIGVRSELGKGSTFWFTLPDLGAVAPHQEEALQDAPPSRPPEIDDSMRSKVSTGRPSSSNFAKPTGATTASQTLEGLDQALAQAFQRISPQDTNAWVPHRDDAPRH